MKLFAYGKDGGQDSTVWGYWLIEWKRFFSIALLCFEDGSREAFHSHAFNSASWVLTGKLVEHHLDGTTNVHTGVLIGVKHTVWGTLPRLVVTRRSTFHKVSSIGRTWVLTFRGPWRTPWREYHPREDRHVVLTHGRKEVA